MATGEPQGKVLVIDDEQGPRESLKMVLKGPYEVVTADHVDEGLRKFEEENPDLVILDIRMPGRNGIEALKEIRERDSEVAVIMLTGYGALETAQQAIRLGANDYLEKPFDINNIRKIVDTNVAHTRLNRRRNRAEHELESLTERLQSEIGVKDNMASLGVASAELVHDIRNPLTVVLGYVQLMMHQLGELSTGDSERDSQDLSEYLGAIEKNARYCAKLAEDWHMLGRGEHDSVEPVAIPGLLRDVVENAQAVDPEAAIRLEIESPEDDLTCRAAHIQLQRALQNIVNNSVQSLQGRDVRNVDIHCSRNGDGQIRIVIADTGCGIARETLEWIFEPFKTTKKGVQKGTGLGMFITKKVIDRHGGRIEFESEEGRGTTVTVLLPERPPDHMDEGKNADA
ncbi:hybrid sensor histidine kinase/response regulator [Kiritimatiella glycovorans]|uniref:histidine kinase n=1 Tax=Kiritimatiella glycovorans TaxID=1307763 RepID=A0A0G3EIV7_9BACT|nr:hybrid sensor histidine kinase/response regulator [Kiritimatiella glycovorans]AKJ65337.1 Response receiver histidine kinase [Kiritimatiella glycovorans]